MASIFRHRFKSNPIFSFRLILRPQFFSSTSTTTPTKAPILSPNSPNSLTPLINWLVDSLGFSQNDAVTTSTRLTKRRVLRGATQVSGLKFLRNADLVLVLLHQKGLQISHIRKVIFHAPQVLTMKIEHTLEPKLKFLRDLTLSDSDFAQLVASFPEILKFSLDSTLRPTVEYLKEILGDNESVVKVIRRLRWRDFTHINAYLGDNIALLTGKGISIEAIQKCMVAQSNQFLRSTPAFKDLMVRVEQHWGISPHSSMFLPAVRLLGCHPEKTIESKCRVYESFGWGRSDVLELLRKNPYCLSAAEGTVKVKLRFFMDELGYDPGYIAAHPALILYSFEKRVLPRYGVFCRLKEEGLIRENSSFYTAVFYNESKFLERFVVPFEKELPGLLELYVKSMGSSGHQQCRRGRKPVSSKTKLKPS